MLSIRHIAIFGVLCLFITLLQAQIHPRQLRNEVLQSQKPVQKKVRKAKTAKAKQEDFKANMSNKPLAPIVNPLSNKRATIVLLENTETLSYDEQKDPDIKILKGNVRFRHDNAVMYCDSAYFYEKANSLDAFSNVRIVQGDTLFVYGDFLYYDGNARVAKLRHNVKMVNRKTVLTTDSMNYDRNTNLVYYYTGGKIADNQNTLTSVWGQYSPANKNALFKENVKLVNKNFTMDADTLTYNTESKVANIVGPTHIVYKNETDIYSKLGWYNTSTEQMMLLNQSDIIHKGGKTLTGDTIFYDKAKKFGEAFNHVVLKDTVQKSTLYGNYIYYNEDGESGLAADSAMLVDWSSPDTLWMHADTLRTYKDSIYNVARGDGNVRIFRNDVQGICDSLLYSARDSVINLHGSPVLWAEKNQLSGNFIQAFTKNKKVERVHIQKDAMATQKLDSLHYNQLSGKEIIAYVDSGQLRRVNVNGNAETIYYPIDGGDSTIVGLNKTESSFVTMYLKNKKIERIVMTSATTGVMYPLGQLSGGDLYLKNFFWLEEQRPEKSSDVLLTIPKKPVVKIGTSSIMGKNPGGDVNTKQGNTQKNSKGQSQTNGTLKSSTGNTSNIKSNILTR